MARRTNIGRTGGPELPASSDSRDNRDGDFREGKAIQPLPAGGGESKDESQLDTKENARDRETQVRTTLTLPAGGPHVHMVDEFDHVGVKVTFPAGSNRPDEDDLAAIRRHVKAAQGEPPTRYRWDKRKFWRKLIEGRDGDKASPQKSIAIRHDTERRVEDLAAELKDRHGSAAGHAHRLDQRRAGENEPGQIPD